MKRIVSSLLIMMLMLGGLLPACAIDAKVRIMDLTHIKGVRENQLVGYGVVVGLPGTGDNSRSTQITNKMLLRNLGTVIEQENYIQKGGISWKTSSSEWMKSHRNWMYQLPTLTS